MSFLSNLAAQLPFSKRQEIPEVFFALNIATEKLTAALWSIEGNKLRILDTAVENYSSEAEVAPVTDKLLDMVVGEKEVDPQKILFGVPDSWLSDENLKENYLKLLRKLVKELEVVPMAYVSSSNALVHLLEKKEGVPTTAVLVGLEQKHLTVTVVRAGKMDGTKVAQRSDDLGVDIEKALLNFTGVEVLPSKILIYGLDKSLLEKTKLGLLSFAWMSKLSFLHFPKIEVLFDDIAIAAVSFAGASEMKPEVEYVESEEKKRLVSPSELVKIPDEDKQTKQPQPADKGSLGFVVGDVAARKLPGAEQVPVSAKPEMPDEVGAGSEDLGSEVASSQTVDQDEEETSAQNLEGPAVPDPEEPDYPLEEDFKEPTERSAASEETEYDVTAPVSGNKKLKLQPSLSFGFLKKVIPVGSGNFPILAGVGGVFILLILAFLFLSKADVKVFVEPRVLERDTQVTADPAIKTVNENEKKIPGQTVETEVTGSGTGSATGKKQVGDSAKGTVVIRNKTDGAVTLSKGTTLASNGLSFSLDLAVTIASRSADDGTWGKGTGTVTAGAIGPDSNLPSGSDLTISGYPTGQLTAKAEGNFSGGTSKDVTVVSSDDQQKLLAQVASDLRKSAQQKLQEKSPDKKIPAEALSETIVKKSFNKNTGDQAANFTLSLIARYSGTAYDDKDLRTIVSKLVSTDIPADFSLDLAGTETQADVSKLEKNGRIIFLARFKAKLIPKVDTDKLKNEIKGKSQAAALDIIKGLDNVLGGEIKLTPKLPGPLARIPFFEKNINIEVGLK